VQELEAEVQRLHRELQESKDLEAAAVNQVSGMAWHHGMARYEGHGVLGAHTASDQGMVDKVER